jgi:dihydroneopterin aldolase
LKSDRRPDVLKLSGIKIFPRIGVTPEERAAPQECRADVVISGNWAGAAATDNLADSIDYCLILEKVRAVAAAREYVLLETLVHAVAQSVLTDFPVGSVNVKVRKRPAVLRDLLDFVEIEVEATSENLEIKACDQDKSGVYTR